MNKRPTIIFYRESLLQSVISDVITFGLLLLCIWASQGSTWWTVVTACMFLTFLAVRISWGIANKPLRFHSLAGLREWLDGQEDKP